MERFFLCLAAIILIIACGEPVNEQIGLRSDGYYAHEKSTIVYLLRFSPKGNVVITGGPKDQLAGMIEMLDPEVPDQNNVYNVPYVIQPNDSVHFHTTSPKGRIVYSGLSFHSDTLRLLKKSLINGKEGLLDYVFFSDPK